MNQVLLRHPRHAELGLHGDQHRDPETQWVEPFRSLRLIWSLDSILFASLRHVS